MSQTNDDDFLSQYIANESSAQHAADEHAPEVEPDVVPPAGLPSDPEGTAILQDPDAHARLMAEVDAYRARPTSEETTRPPRTSADEPTTIGVIPPFSGPRHGQPAPDQGRHTQPPQAPPAPPQRPVWDNSAQFGPQPGAQWNGQPQPGAQWNGQPQPGAQWDGQPQPGSPQGGQQQPYGQGNIRSQGDSVLDDDSSASVGRTRAEIHEANVVRPYKLVPQTGWRKGVYKATRLNLGLSKDETHWNDLKRRLKVNVRGRYVIAVMQGKGGVTKTTSAAILGAVLAQYRDEKVVAIDGNPASGNLAKRIDEPSTESWRGLNADPRLINYSDFRNYLGKDSHSGLEVLGSDRGKVPMSGADLREAWARLQKLYPIAIVDCGTQHLDDLTRAILDYLPIDALVVPSTTSLDSAIEASATLNWLMDEGYPHLVREAVVIVSNVKKVDASTQVKQLHKDFERTVKSVHSVGFDPHLSDAVAIDINRLQPQTWQTYVEAAASLADGFTRAAEREPQQPSHPQRSPQQPGPMVGQQQPGPGPWQQGGGQGQWQGNQHPGAGQWPTDGRWQGGQNR
ncbi:AAA family ATPase [Mycolicibacterium sphagni]|uniref:nucleotide-binding protein n=1 Tax=Mycolicibacterium sphagni TaxID=1786 RepID=UPI0031F55624